MQRVDPRDWQTVEGRLPPERSCEIVASHVLSTGIGSIWATGGLIAAFTGGNLAIIGDPGTAAPGALRALLDRLLADWDRVFIATEEEIGTRLREEMPMLRGWPRVYYSLPPDAARSEAETAAGTTVRRLEPRDEAALRGLGDDIAWIADTHDGPAALAASGRAHGVWRGDRLASVAATFYAGRRWEELGVVTESDERGHGLSPLCATALLDDIRGRGRRACWSTTPDNVASQRVAEKLGFRRERETLHLLAGAATTGSIPLPPVD